MSRLTWEDVGARLKSAREDLGLTQEEVAKRLDISRPAVSLIESGKRPVNSMELNALAKLYHRPLEWFLAGELKQDDLVVLLRAEQIREVEYAQLLDFKNLLEQYAELERLVLGNVPQLQVGYEASQLGRTAIEQGERLAEEERRRLGIGEDPILNLPQLLELAGVKVILRELPGDVQLAGAAFPSQEAGPAILINVGPDVETNKNPGRWNFTAAHEYAHLLVDRHGTALVDLDQYLTTRVPLEVRANAFAATFLMPKPGLLKELEIIGWTKEAEIPPEMVVHLQYRFGVSYQAMLYRLTNVGLITEAQRNEYSERYRPTELGWWLGYNRFRTNLAQGWISVGIDRPIRFRWLALQAYERGLISIGKLSELLGLDRLMVERIVVDPTYDPTPDQDANRE